MNTELSHFFCKLKKKLNNRWRRSWHSTVLMRDKLKMDEVLVLHRVYTHSKDMDTWKTTCSVVSQLTHYSNLPAAWTAIKKNKTVGEKFSLTSDRTQGGI